MLNDKVIIEEERDSYDLSPELIKEKMTFDGALASKNPNHPYEVAYSLPAETYIYDDRYSKNTSIGIVKFQEFLTQAEHLLSKGEHKLTLQIQPMFSHGGTLVLGPLFSGDLTLLVEDKIADSNNPEVCFARGELQKDVVLLEEAKQVYKAKTGELKNDFIISSDEWDITRHSISGVILSRSIEVSVGGDGENGCFYQTYFFTQSFDGTNYGKLKLNSHSDRHISVPCDCLVDEY